ncbi:Transcription factor [Nymphaea thermarum]|nr:Transcription factor [Nymphaea thermarum]
MQMMGSFHAAGDVGRKRFSGVFGGFENGGGQFNVGALMSSSSSSSLVLDSEKGELVKASDLMRKQMAEAKATMALKSHSEAERRRRERINRHLTTLRGLVPCTTKMDKASLLAEVITNVKELKRNAEVLTKGCVVPTDYDEVQVEYDADKGTSYIRASLCCDDRPELWTELKQMLQNLQLKTVSAETSTLGGRVKNVFIFTPGEHVDEAKQRSAARSVQQALKSVLERVSSTDFSPRSTVSSKRHRSSPFESSSSSS